MLWDYQRFPRGTSKWVDQAFDKHKYAFAADYIRLYALYNYGGIYLDSDVEVLRSYNDLLDLPYFIGAEQTEYGIEAATIAFPQGSVFIKGILDSYLNKDFINNDNSLNTEPLPRIIRRYIAANYEYHLIHNKEEYMDDPSIINVFSEDFFSPKNYKTKEVKKTRNTYSIHHFDGSWVSTNNEGAPSPQKKISQKSSVKKNIRYHLLPHNINIISSFDISNIFFHKFNVSSHNPTLRGEISDEDIAFLTEHKIDLNANKITFIKKEKSKSKIPNCDFYPIVGIIGTKIEIHFINDFSREDIRDYWVKEYNILKKRRNIYITPTEKKINKYRLYLAILMILIGYTKIKL